MNITDLNTSEFITKVGDYKTYPDNWKYIGHKPCLVTFHAGAAIAKPYIPF